MRVSIPDRVLGFFRLREALMEAKTKKVSIPDRVLGFFRPPVPEARLYLVFKVQLRPAKIQVPFQPSACQYLSFHTHSKTLSCKAFTLCVSLVFTLGASNSCCT